MNSFSFTLSGKQFIYPSIPNDSFAGQSNLGCRSLLFMTLSTSCQFLLAYRVSFEKSANSLMGTPLEVTNFFPLAAFKVLSLCLTFGILIMMCLGVVLFGSSCLGLSVLPGLVCLFPSQDWEIFFLYFLQVSFQFLALPVLLLVPLRSKCWNI